MISSAPSKVILLFFVLLTFTTVAVGDDEKSLLIKDAEGLLLVDPIRMVGTVTVSADGSVEVITEDILACDGPVVTCDDVEVGGLAFSATRQQVEVGEVIEFSWYSRGAWACDAGGDLPGWSDRAGLPPDSNRATNAQRRVGTAELESANPNDFPLSFTAELLCHNGPVESNDGQPRVVSVLIEAIEDPEEGVPDECAFASRRPPSNWRRLSTGSQSCRWNGSSSFLSSADCFFWEGVWPVPFLAGQYSTSRYLATRSADAQDYIAVRFNSGSFSDSYRLGDFHFEAAPNITNTTRIVSISRCPGDFNREAITAEVGSGCIRRFTGPTGNLTWGGPESSGPSCKLEQNTDYFFNVVFTETPLNGVSWETIEPHPTCQGIGNSNRCGTAVSAK